MSLIAKRDQRWSVVYRTAYNEDGTLWYPERLNDEFLTSAKKLMGTRIFANQYLNEIFPSEDAVFKEEWFRYYEELPKRYATVAFIDPAISQDDGADYTGYTVVSTDTKKNWYVRIARRERLTPSQIINLMFQLHENFKLDVLGVEETAYQKALLYMAHDEMMRRGVVLPLSGVHHGNQRTKEMRIAGALVPRMEWGFIHLPRGENIEALKREMLQFPAAAHDDIIDSLASCESIMTYPTEEKEVTHEGNPHHPDFERAYIRSLAERANEEL